MLHQHAQSAKNWSWRSGSQAFPPPNIKVASLTSTPVNFRIQLSSPAARGVSGDCG